jgi:hypothetical protein
MGCFDVQAMPHVLRNHIEGVMVSVLTASLVNRGWSFRISSVKHSNFVAFHDEYLSFLSFTGHGFLFISIVKNK